jgi:hypothetical protein
MCCIQRSWFNCFLFIIGKLYLIYRFRFIALVGRLERRDGLLIFLLLARWSLLLVRGWFRSGIADDAAEIVLEN